VNVARQISEHPTEGLFGQRGKGEGPRRRARRAWAADRALWMHVTDYQQCQALADTARAARRTSRDRDSLRVVLSTAVLNSTRVRAGAIHRRFFLPQSSSSSRFTAGAFAFFILSQSGERPER
jgi:hypothetical protein